MSKLNRLKANNFPDLSSLSTQSDFQEVLKKKGGRPKSKEPLERLSFTLTSKQVTYLKNLVEKEISQGLNSNISHVIRQMVERAMREDML